jgi:hypothetical protein
MSRPVHHGTYSIRHGSGEIRAMIRHVQCGSGWFGYTIIVFNSWLVLKEGEIRFVFQKPRDFPTLKIVQD